MRKQWIPAIVGILFAFLAMGFGSYDDLWAAIGMANSPMRGTLTMTLSLISVAVGFLSTILTELGRQGQKFDGFRHDLPDFLSSRFPQLKAFGVYDTDEANEMFLGRIERKEIKSALNTRIFTEAIACQHVVSENFDERLADAIQEGLRFKEVVGASRLDECHRLKALLNNPAGHYDVALLTTVTPVLNFIVLTLSNGEKEVWFGWPIARGTGGDALTAVTREPRVIQIFERWHGELFGAAAKGLSSAKSPVSCADARDVSCRKRRREHQTKY